MEPDTAPALCTGTLDQMVDQVTQSIVFVQKQYPGNQWVSLQIFLLSDWVGGQWIHLLGCSPAIPSGFGAEGKWDPPSRLGCCFDYTEGKPRSLL